MEEKECGYLDNNENYRLELVSTRLIKRMTGLQNDVNPKKIEKIRKFAKERGYCRPVVLSDSSGCMTLLAGAATFEACLKEKEVRIPAVVVQTEGEADNLMFALQAAQLDETPCTIAVSEAIVKLIDTHSVPRKQIAMLLGKSPAWINRMENLCRKLNVTVQTMVTDGQVSPRSAFEIARLPDEVQVAFAVSTSNEFLSKDNIAYLVNRYVNKDNSTEERQRIIYTPKLALPNEFKHRGRIGKDNSDDARFSHAIARCMDDSLYLSQILDRIDIKEIIIRESDIVALSDILAALLQQLLAVFSPGKNPDKINTCQHTCEDECTDGSKPNAHSTTGKNRKKTVDSILTKAQQKKFDKFWEVYPNKKSIGQAEKTFAGLDPDDGLFQEILDGLNQAKKYDHRFIDGYIPHPSTWLNAKGWKDSYETARNRTLLDNARRTGDFNQREYADDFYDRFISNKFGEEAQIPVRGDADD
jgi:ParB-like chromosome segregation protein Spo0J